MIPPTLSTMKAPHGLVFFVERVAGLMAIVILLWLLALATSKCGTMAPRENARAAVLVLAEAANQADEACAKIARERADLVLARYCEDAYTDSRAMLVGAAEGVDAWSDATKRRNAACAVGKATRALEAWGIVLEKRKVPIPPVVVDALKIAGALGGCAS